MNRDIRWNKGSILKASVKHMRELQNRISRCQEMETKDKESRAIIEKLTARVRVRSLLRCNYSDRHFYIRVFTGL